MMSFSTARPISNKSASILVLAAEVTKITNSASIKPEVLPIDLPEICQANQAKCFSSEHPFSLISSQFPEPASL